MLKKEFIQKYNGKKFIRHIENHQSKSVVFDKAIELIKEQGLSTEPLKFENGRWVYLNSTFFVDRRIQDAHVLITFRSKDYIAFDGDKNSYGEIPPADNFTDNSFYIACENKKVIYTLVE